jgi:hypothetical protein
MNEREIRVRVGNVSVQVPVIENPATTRRIAEQLTEDFARIERESTRIDTQAFLVKLAFEQAAQAHELRAELEETNKAFLRELDAVLSRLSTLRDQCFDAES